jgi:hypothetical protein
MATTDSMLTIMRRLSVISLPPGSVPSILRLDSTLCNNSRGPAMVYAIGIQLSAHGIRFRPSQRHPGLGVVAARLPTLQVARQLRGALQ